MTQSTFEKLFDQSNLSQIRRKMKVCNWAHLLEPLKYDSKVENKTITLLGFSIETLKNGKEVLAVTYEMTDARQPKPIYTYWVQDEVLPYLAKAIEDEILVVNENYVATIEMWEDKYGKRGNRWLGAKMR